MTKQEIYNKDNPVVGFRTDPETKEYLKILSDRSDVRLQKFVKGIVDDYLVKHGHVVVEKSFRKDKL